MPNLLAAERSLYLRQHANNPVPWMPWCDEAFERARREHKLVFVSIGYSACHWCHVMEHESFADPEVAHVLEQWYVPIKVDREERPDVDALYMSICQAMTGHGGWPLTVILTPDRDVVFIGTYFPKRSTPYRIGLIELLERVATLWREDTDKVRFTSHSLMQRIAPHLLSARQGTITAVTLESAVEQLSQRYDATYGGFGTRPKFPMAAALWLLIIHGTRGNTRSLELASETLEAMRWGGIWDHVGFGFHRYSTDEQWRLPHFEKMLYDQALLLLVYAEAARCTGNDLFYRTAHEIATYMERDLLIECGAYASSYDADTVNGEGAFYLWRYEELEQHFAPHELEQLQSIFHLEREGNFRHEATGERTGHNILYAGTRTSDVLKRFGGTLHEFFTWWESVRQRLEQLRDVRPKPIRDEKVLCDWNALAVVALARGGRMLHQSSLVDHACRVWSYLERVHMLPDGSIVHCSYDGVPATDGFIDDYAFTAWAALELYHATGRINFLSHAQSLVRSIAERFTDDNGILRTAQTTDLLPLTEASDGATVSAVGITALVSAMLSLHGSDTFFSTFSQQILERYGGNVHDQPAWHATLLIAWLHATEGTVLDIDCPVHQRAQLEQLLNDLYDPLRLDRVTFSSNEQLRAQRCTATGCTLISSWHEFRNALSTVAHSRKEVPNDG